MATSNEKLADSLRALKELQDNGRVAIRSADLTRTHRERLLNAGFLREVIRGWFIASNPADRPGDSTSWYSSFWDFCAQYLTARFDDDWSLSPEQSLVLHAGDNTVPDQLLVRAPRARNKRTDLSHGSSIFETRAGIAKGNALIVVDGMRLFRLEDALIGVQASYFQLCSTQARTVLATVSDASLLLGKLLDGEHSIVAGRLAGAFRSIGNDAIANEILKGMRRANFEVRESNPFVSDVVVADAGRIRSPHTHRIRLMWQKMREPIIENLPAPKPIANDIEAYLNSMDEIYVTDAYHSLSIEGYQVSPELIERVQSGDWNPETEEEDRNARNAMAARGYWEAFQEVRKSVRDTLEGESAGKVVERDLSDWYQSLFAPSVTAGILKASQLAGYRNAPVYIRQSQHVPMNIEAVRECMPVFYELLKEEEDARARIVLGHFVFVFIHPFLDGNGRTARFLMNVMMASAGYPWLVIKVDDRNAYMAALEAASVKEDIVPFANFIGQQMVSKIEKGE